MLVANHSERLWWKIALAVGAVAVVVTPGSQSFCSIEVHSTSLQKDCEATGQKQTTTKGRKQRNWHLSVLPGSRNKQGTQDWVITGGSEMSGNSSEK